MPTPARSFHHCLTHELCDFYDRHTMLTETLRPLQRKGADYIFTNGRLLIGSLASGPQRTEAWLAKTTPSDATGAATEMRGWRIYTSAHGSGHPWNDIMNLRELHPALRARLIDENSEEFMRKSRKDRLEFLSERYEDVVRGRYKYSERQGGELKFMAGEEMFPRHNVGNAPKGQEQKEGQKRKRDPDSSEDPMKDKKAKLFPGCFDDNNDDDDEELPPNALKKEMDAMHQTPMLQEPTIPDSRQHRPPQRQSQDQISASIASLGLTEKSVPGDRNPPDQKHDIRGAVKPDPMVLTALAHSLRDDMVS